MSELETVVVPSSSVARQLDRDKEPEEKDGE
jgi:hypothetical protein